MDLKQVYATPDGKQFDTKAEALDYLRRPLITAALNKVAPDNPELVDWLLANQEAVETNFESTKIKRVTKSEHKQLEKALEAVASAGEKSFAFITDNASAILDSFRWPSVKRGTEEEQAATIKNGFLALTGEPAEKPELTDWIIANKDAILEAYQAGVVKREVNPKAAEALAAYQAKKKAEKEAKAAAAAAQEAKAA